MFLFFLLKMDFLSKALTVAAQAINVVSIIFGILILPGISCNNGIKETAAIVVIISGIFQVLTKAKDYTVIKKIEKQNKIFAENNAQMRNNLEMQEKANKNLLMIQEQSQELLHNLMHVGDDFNKFGEILEKTTKENISLTEKLKELIDTLSKKKSEKQIMGNTKKSDEFLKITDF